MTYNRKTGMCGDKLAFPTRNSAEKHAIKYDQYVYNCPVCFTWHCTSQKDWRINYVDRKLYDNLLAKNHILQAKVKQLEELLAESN